MPNNRQTGKEKEQAAAEYLKNNGIEILAMNFRSRTAEIDIIGKEGDTLCFFEVKYRKDLSKGYPAEAVDEKKQHKIIKAAGYYMYINNLPECSCRFDVIAILGNKINWIKNAF